MFSSKVISETHKKERSRNQHKLTVESGQETFISKLQGKGSISVAYSRVEWFKFCQSVLLVCATEKSIQRLQGLHSVSVVMKALRQC